jgi:hypothetical protein
MRSSASAARTCNDNSARPEDTADDGGAVIGFKSGQACREQFASGYDDDIEARRDVIATKNLSNQSLRAISNDRSTEPLGRGYSQPANREAIRPREQRVIPARNPGTVRINVLKIGVTAKVLAGAKLQQSLFTTDA